ncbi:hypothetical protein LCGC14_2659970, partial [marine sediment metagenome]
TTGAFSTGGGVATGFGLLRRSPTLALNRTLSGEGSLAENLLMDFNKDRQQGEPQDYENRVAILRKILPQHSVRFR